MKRIKVLLVNDNGEENKLHERLLYRLNLAEEVIIKTTATNAIQYLKHIKTFTSPENFLVMLNLQLKKGTAFDFLAEFEKSVPISNITILSNVQSPDDIARLSKMGKYHLVIKPLDEDEMLNIYHKYFRDKMDINQPQTA